MASSAAAEIPPRFPPPASPRPRGSQASSRSPGAGVARSPQPSGPLASLRGGGSARRAPEFQVPATLVKTYVKKTMLLTGCCLCFNAFVLF